MQLVFFSLDFLLITKETMIIPTTPNITCPECTAEPLTIYFLKIYVVIFLCDVFPYACHDAGE